MSKIEFKKMSHADLSLWNKWIEIPHVKEEWFIEGYEPADYMAKKIAGSGYDFPFIIYLDKMPLGFIQACDLYAYRTMCPKPKGVFCHEEPGTFCLDLFIAEETNLNQGYGSKIIKAFVEKLRDEFQAKKILIDPSVKNIRAIRCYEKSGFKSVKTAHDGVSEVLIMEWQPEMLIRECMRAILLNDKGEILLLKADDPKTTTTSGQYNGPFWFLVGGAIEPKENEEEAVLREIYEETGIKKDQIKLGPVVWRGDLDLIINGRLTRLRQRFMVAKSAATDLSLEHLTTQEKQVIKDIRWFSLKDIEESKELIYPHCLKQYLPDILADIYPKQALEIIL
jgi:8-oxo-dGTP pyrophosphatase MutT (NUDIX family)/RimJ/RimL family protein N-acetyltransferase